MLVLDGQSPEDVAEKLQVSENTVRQWTGRLASRGSVADLPRTGRPKSLTAAQTAAIVAVAKAKKFVTPKQIAAELDLAVSARTVRRALDGQGLFGRIARLVPALKPKHVQARLSFANGYGNWTATQWARVLWSDETSIQLGPNGQNWIQRPVGSAFEPEYTQGTIKHPPKVHFWGCFSRNGVGTCHIFVENLDSLLMKKILSNLLLSAKEKFFPTGMWYFQQDNDPKHSSRLVQDWLHNNGITCLDWPPYSPDLNPIEHLWSDLKKRCEKHKPKTIEELITLIQLEWAATDKEYLKKLVDSLPRRCRAVIANKGHASGY